MYLAFIYKVYNLALEFKKVIVGYKIKGTLGKF